MAGSWEELLGPEGVMRTRTQRHLQGRLQKEERGLSAFAWDAQGWATHTAPGVPVSILPESAAQEKSP